MQTQVCNSMIKVVEKGGELSNKSAKVNFELFGEFFLDIFQNLFLIDSIAQIARF